jgi:predicted extracellular nuclease
MVRHGILILSVAAVLLYSNIAAAVEIWEIQGSGMASPLEGQRVTTADNVVFAVGETGFFMQTPDERSDEDELTSDGIWVFTVSAPEVEVGDSVEVVATVVEYYGLTELGGTPVVSVTASGVALPRAVAFDAERPVGDQPWDPTTLERFEGMRIVIDAGIICGPTDSYGDVGIAAGQGRLRREPGIEWPGLEDLPLWDGNPEGFEMNPDALGLPDGVFAAGTSFQAEGGLTYVWGDYQLWPSRLDLGSSPTLPLAPPLTHGLALRVAAQNVERLGPRLSEDYEVELVKDALQIVDVLRLPEIVVIEEVEDLDALEDLASAIMDLVPGVFYRASLIEGHGYGGINVGFLVQNGVTMVREEQIGADVLFDWDGSRLYDRPPLVLECSVPATDIDLTVVAVHLRSLRGIDDDHDGPRVRAKRDAQARWLAGWLQERQIERPAEALLVAGDFNAFEFTDGYVDVIGQITGTPDPAGALFPASAEVDPPLFDVASLLPADQRYTYVYHGNTQVLDHILVNRRAMPLVAAVHAVRGNADVSEALADDPNTPLRSSDHDGLVLTLISTQARNPRGGRTGG